MKAGSLKPRFSALFLCVVTSGCSAPPVPKDAELIDHFSANRDAYEEVVKAVLSYDLTRIGLSSDGSIAISPSGVVGDVDRVRSLLTQLEVDLIVPSYVPGKYGVIGEVAFLNYRSGIISAYTHKGLAYVISGDAPANSVQSLDEVANESSEWHGVKFYRRIDSHWFIFYEAM